MIRLVLNSIVSKIKGDEFILDSKIPISYLFNFFLNKLMMQLRGYTYLFIKRKKLFFVGSGTNINCSFKIVAKNNVVIGNRCFIDALSVDGVYFGNNSSVGYNTTIMCSGTLRRIGKGLIVGDGVGMGTHSFYGCSGGITIGNNTIFGNYVSLHSENHNYKDESKPIKEQGVNRKGIAVGNNCWIGAKVTILDGVTIEDNVIIAAGAVVTEGIYRSGSIYGGVPAKLLKTYRND